MGFHDIFLFFVWQMGTLHYMSPEAIQSGPLNSINIFGKHPMMVRRGSDVWSLGCIIYKMVCGRCAWFTLPMCHCQLDVAANANAVLQLCTKLLTT